MINVGESVNVKIRLLQSSSGVRSSPKGIARGRGYGVGNEQEDCVQDASRSIAKNNNSPTNCRSGSGIPFQYHAFNIHLVISLHFCLYSNSCSYIRNTKNRAHREKVLIHEKASLWIWKKFFFTISMFLKITFLILSKYNRCIPIKISKIVYICNKYLLNIIQIFFVLHIFFICKIDNTIAIFL